MINRNTVAVTVAAILASAMRVGYAQEQPEKPAETDDGLGEVVVTGLRSSLQEAMDIKRDAIGVVDAISAEDIGKFADQNLSEALQRITGISISRRNGEGALVTARGFGSEYNMVTLNGRMMPAADAYGGGGNGFDGGVNGQSRSFNFANLASESISGIEVYKTGKANIATGGIGASVNILTARPFDNQGTVANFGAKLVNDTTNRAGEDITPEVSGIYSFANDDRTWGVALAGSYQSRDSGSTMSTINDWNIRTWTADLAKSGTQWAPGANIQNAPAVGQLYAIPNDIRYHFADRERERTNGQLTFQFRPNDTMTMTADYTYAEVDLVEDRGDQTLWMNANRFRAATFDDGVVKTPLLLEEDEGVAKDFGFEQQHREQKNELNSIGINLGWNVNDTFRMKFDAHDSKAESLPNDPLTGGGETLLSFAARMPTTCDPTGDPDIAPTNCTNRIVQTFMFNNGLPVAQRKIFTGKTTTAPLTGGDPNFAFPASSLGSQYLRINYQEQVTDLTQFRLDGELDFKEDQRFQFGVETRAMESTQRASGAQMTLGDWGVATPGEMPAEFLTPFSVVGDFSDFDTSAIPQSGWKGDTNALAQWAVNKYQNWRDPGNTTGVLGFNPDFNQNHTIQEDTMAAYVQFGMKSELMGLPTNLLVGVRYETTDVESTSVVFVSPGLLWQDNNDFSVRQGGPTTADTFSIDADYDHFLPSLDFDIELRDDLKARMGYSKTIARAQYDQLRAAVVPGGTQGSSLNGFRPEADAGQPGLVPLESDNLDMSLEWYFGRSSYAAVGLFGKKVSNFIGLQVSPESVYGITDQTSGPRAQAAVAELQRRGFTTDDTNLFVMMAMMENTGTFVDGDGVSWTGGAANFNASEAQHLAFAAKYDITSNASDPAYQFNVTRPVNNREADIWGTELAAQHFFGDTGFGVQANYTIVRGDVDFDNAGAVGVNQFALLGLSDSANVVGIYEKFGFTVRLAWNWRDEYLSNANVGNSTNPVYVDAYEQVDLSVGYQVNDKLNVSFEGLNLTEEDVRWFGRADNQTWFVEDQGARFSLGARYKF